MTRAQTALLALAAFFATGAVAVFAQTVAPMTAFLLGGGWVLVIAAVYRWAEEAERG